MARVDNSTACCCCTCISTGTLGLIESMGKFDGVVEPGLVCFNPFTQAVAGRVSLRVTQLSVDAPTKSKDNVVVTLTIVVQYRVLPEKVEEAFYKMSNPPAQIRSFVTNVVRGQVPLHTLDEIFVLRDELQDEVKKELDAMLEKYGFVLVAALICDIVPAFGVRDAMNQINTNARLKVAQAHRSEAEKYEIVKAAEADAEAKRLSGVGMAEQRKAAISGLQVSVENFQNNVPGMSAKDVMSLLLMNQYFDCIKDIAEAGGKGANTVFVPNSGGNSVAEGVISASVASRGAAAAAAGAGAPGQAMNRRR
jgi:regulator of protease activity HflC (stomatin/prohibitin superfamily)